MKVVFYILIIFFLLGASRDQFWFRYPIEKVVNIHDGDTMTIDYKMAKNIVVKNEKIRLLGCDAYELKDSKGKIAKKFTENFLSTGTLTLITQGERDSFGRLLSFIERDGIFLNDAITSANLTTGKWKIVYSPSR